MDISVKYRTDPIFNSHQYVSSPISLISPISPFSQFSPFSPITSKLSVISDRPIVLNPGSPFNNQPFELNVDMTNAPELIPFYENISGHPRVVARTTKYFYYKTLDKWLKHDEDGMKHLLNYLTVNKQGNVELIKSLDKIDENSYLKDSNNDMVKKIKYIEENVLSQERLKKVLLKYSQDTGINMYNLFEIEKFIRSLIANHLKSRLKKKILSN